MVPIPEEAEAHSEYSDNTEYSSDGVYSGSSCAASPRMEELDGPGELAGSGSCHVGDAKAIKLKWNQTYGSGTFGQQSNAEEK